MTAAFQEFSAKKLNREKKPSIRKALAAAKDKAKQLNARPRQGKENGQGARDMKQINYKKLILPNIPYVFFVYLFDKVGQAVRLAPGADFLQRY